MKPIKDCKWNVILTNFAWTAYTKSGSGIMGLGSETRPLNPKRHWEKFAKINGIKNWRYV